MGAGYVRYRVASAPARVLLHLLCASQSGEPELHRLTQEGISHDIRSGRSTVAKALLRLDALDFIAGQREHVPGHRLRKHVYRLTPAGWEEALRERARFERTVIRVRGIAAKDLQVRASDLPELFPSAGDLSQILARVKWGVLPAPGLDANDTEPCLLVAWGPDRPQPKRLVGRVREAQQLDSWLASSSAALTITGLAGIGKTALVAAAVGRWRSRYAVYWAAVRPWSSSAALTADLAKFLAATGRRGLERALVDRADLEQAALFGLLRHELRGFRALLVFDDIHTARPVVRRWFDFLASVIESTPCRIILVGRATVRLRARGPQERRPHELRVGPLDDRAARDLLRLHGWDPNDPITVHIAREARGNPLLLLLGAEAGAAAGREIARFLEDEVWSALTRPERQALEAVCSLRRSAPDRALRAMPGVEAETLRQLERKNLLNRTAAGTFAIHPSVDEFVRSRTPVQRARAYHEAAMRYFLSVPGPTAKLEAIYHALQAGNRDATADLLRREGETLMNSVSFAALRDLLDPPNPAPLPPTACAVLAEARGDALRRGGSIRAAEARFDQALRLADPLRQPGDRARVLRKLAELDRLAGRHARARNRLTEAIHLVGPGGDFREASNVHREFALLEMARGDLREAEEQLRRALRAAAKASDPARYSRALLVLGTLEEARGQAAIGLQRKLRALRHAEASGELLEVARAAISVGVSHAEMKRFADALPYYEQGLQIARLLGDVRLLAVSQLNRAAALLDLERWSEARPALMEADQLLALVGDRVTRGFLSINRGQLEMGLDRWRRAADAFEAGLQTLRSFAGPYDLARGLTDVARFYARRGEHEMAMERLQEALDLARTLQNKELTSNIELELTLVAEIASDAETIPALKRATSAVQPADHWC